MELVVLTLLTVTIALNLMVLFRLRFRPNEVELTTTLEAIEGCRCTCSAVKEGPATVESPLPIPALVPQAPGPTAADEAYHAWKNRTEEPVLAPPSPHGPPPKPGPMQRPYGFSR